MFYTSLNFVIFFAALLILFYSFGRKYRYIVLLLSSLYFFFCLSKVMTVHAVAVSLIAWLTAKQTEKTPKEQISKKKLITGIGIAIIILSWSIVKFRNIWIPAFRDSNMLSRILVPVGISFYTLSLVSYLIDVFNGTVRAEQNPMRLILFTVFFPCIFQGPINRYGIMNEQLQCNRLFDYSAFVTGFERVILGYVKKMVIADRLSEITAAFSLTDSSFTGFTVFLYSVTYMIQLYTDFSGGIDISIGLANMLGINLPENFTRPFFSLTVSEFWRRWHITLGAWLKDYIFYPLTLSKSMVKLSKLLRKKNKNLARLVPAIISMLFLWIFCAFWHGEQTNYIIWGLYFWVLVSIDTILEKPVKAIKNKCSGILLKVFTAGQIIITFILVCIGELISQADSAGQAVSFVGNLFTCNSGNSIIKEILKGNYGLDRKDVMVAFIFVVLIFAFELFVESGLLKNPLKKLATGKIILRWFVLIAGIFVVLIFGYYGPGYVTTPFIYFQF